MFGLDVPTAFLLIAGLIIAAGVHKSELMKETWYQIACIPAFAYGAWFFVVYAQSTAETDTTKNIVFWIGIFMFIAAILKGLRLLSPK